MSKKDYIALADMLIATRPTPCSDLDAGSSMDCFINGQIILWKALRARIGMHLAKSPSFNAKRWTDYTDGKCGPNGGKASSK